MLATKKQTFMTLRDTHTNLCHFNNGVCCGYNSKTKSRPASINISFKIFPHKNNTLVIMHVLAMSSGRKWQSFMFVTSHKRAEHTAKNVYKKFLGENC